MASINHKLFLATQAADARELLEAYIYDQRRESNAIRSYRLDPPKVTIGIEEIRHIQTLASKKYDHPFLIVIPDAQRLTQEAQNALLKLLEDSGQNVRYLFSAPQSAPLLKTLLSRLQIDYYQPPSDQDLVKQEKQVLRSLGYSRKLIDQYLDPQSGLRNALALGKRWLSQERLDRIIQMNGYEVEQYRELIAALRTIIFSMLPRSVENDRTTDLKSAIRRLEAIERTQNRIDSNGNMRLNMAQLCLMI